MKIFFIISALLFIAVKADIETERKELHKMMEECEKEHGEPKNFLERLHKGEDLGDEHKAGVMALCMNMKMGHMNEKGEIIWDKYKEHVKRMFPDEDKAKEVMSDCGTRVGTTPEEAAMNFVRCMTKHLPKPQTLIK